MTSATITDLIRRRIRVIPDFPRKGILFQDITPLLQDADGFRQVTDAMAETFAPLRCDCIAAIEARGFLLGGVLAHRLSLPLALLRKAGKLPWETRRQEYQLEYGSETLEMHTDAIVPGARVLLLDDLLATGGTMEAAVKLVAESGGVPVGIGFVVELVGLGGRERLQGALQEATPDITSFYEVRETS